MIFDLHFADQIVLVLNFVFDFGKILWYSAEVLFLEVVLLLVLRQLWSSKDVFNGISDNKVFVTYKAVNWFFVTLWNCRFRGMVA